jgi:hypothetical protein
MKIIYFLIKKKLTKPNPITKLQTVMSNTAKQGRGRPKGSTSFVRVSINDLIDQFGQNAKVMVSKKFLEQMGFDFEPKPVMTISSITDEPEAEETIQFNVYQ